MTIMIFNFLTKCQNVWRWNNRCSLYHRYYPKITYRYVKYEAARHRRSIMTKNACHAANHHFNYIAVGARQCPVSKTIVIRMKCHPTVDNYHEQISDFIASHPSLKTTPGAFLDDDYEQAIEWKIQKWSPSVYPFEAVRTMVALFQFMSPTSNKVAENRVSCWICVHLMSLLYHSRSSNRPLGFHQSEKAKTNATHGGENR